MPADSGARPGGELGDHFRILPEADDDLAGQAQPRGDEAELAVAVRGLVEVHEVHVDGAPGQVLIELRVQMDEGLGQQREARDPHLCRREGVHPEDQADAFLGVIGLTAQGANGVGAGHHGLEDNVYRNGMVFIQ